MRNLHSRQKDSAYATHAKPEIVTLFGESVDESFQSSRGISHTVHDSFMKCGLGRANWTTIIVEMLVSICGPEILRVFRHLLHCTLTPSSRLFFLSLPQASEYSILS